MKSYEGMIAININNLSKVFRNKKFQKIEALKRLDLKVRKSEVLGFLGPNGAGKSTTIKMVVGLMKPTDGTVQINGHFAERLESRLKVGFLPENPAFYDFLSAREYLSFVGRTFKLSGKNLAIKCDEVLDLVDLKNASKRPIRTYSKGMVQRLGLAQTLVHDPDIFILDEPMSGLDPIGRALVKRIINDLKSKGKTIFFSTHITADVESICDRVAILKNGELQSVDAVEEILLQGLEGHLVHFRNHLGEISEAIVEKDNLVDFLNSTKEEGNEVVLVEPCRKSLEQFFLDKIKTN